MALKKIFLWIWVIKLREWRQQLNQMPSCEKDVVTLKGV